MTSPRLNWGNPAYNATKAQLLGISDSLDKKLTILVERFVWLRRCRFQMLFTMTAPSEW
jgi:hypothetical protein